MRFQTYWSKWSFDYSKVYWDWADNSEYSIFVNYLIIGPLQFEWYSLK